MSDNDDFDEKEFDYGDQENEEENNDEQELVTDVKAFERTSNALFNINYTADNVYNLSDIDQFKIKIISLIKDFSSDPKQSEKSIEYLIDSIPYIKYKNPLAFLIAYFVTATNSDKIDIKTFEKYAKKYKDNGISKEDIIRYSRLIVKYRQA